jgi:cobalt-zinc-cadmium efflux system protein
LYVNISSNGSVVFVSVRLCFKFSRILLDCPVTGNHAHHHSHDDHHHNHQGHRHHRPESRNAFRLSILLNTALAVFQILIGLFFGSIALVGDAIHNLGDVIGLAIAWGAERISRRSATDQYTFGLGRSTQMASLTNAVLVLAASLIVVFESVIRIFHPFRVVAVPIAVAAALGILINLLSARLFGDDHHHDLNRRAAVVHMLTDAAVSGAVLISAILVGITDWFWLDAVVGVGVGLVVGRSGWRLFKEALSLLMDGVPKGLDAVVLRKRILAVPGVLDVHDMWVWSNSTSTISFTAHVHHSRAPQEAAVLLLEIRKILHVMNIDHSTIELDS